METQSIIFIAIGLTGSAIILILAVLQKKRLTKEEKKNNYTGFPYSDENK